MKWSVVVLLVLGVVAAICAAVLVMTLKGDGGGGTNFAGDGGEVREGSYVVAARDLAARTVVETSAVEVRTTSAKEVPLGSYAQPAQVVGQVLRRPLKKGQLFDQSSFSSEGTGVVLAGALQEGKRAVSVPLSDSGGVEALLYPGCMVDVLCVMNLKDNEGLGDQPMSMTLLQGIYVLAVGGQTVVTPANPDDKGLPPRGPAATVTVLVDTKQAEMLYLARQRGSVSVSLRNPMDTIEVGTEGTRLPSLSPLFADVEKKALIRIEERRREAEAEIERSRTKANYEMEQAQYNIERARKEAEIMKIELDRRKLESERAAQETIKPQWETRVIRGGAEDVRKFDLPEKTGGKK
ncbi:MAG: Flp pilus assembly protein CpaB [Planctomycetota bacterium]